MGIDSASDFDEYADRYPEAVRKRLREVRKTIRDAAPDATETISYGMPAFRLNGIVAWFGAHTHHIGFYSGASGIAAFKKEMADYVSAKGSVQFPFDKPLPLTLIAKVVEFRVRELSLKRTKRSSSP